MVEPAVCRADAAAPGLGKERDYRPEIDGLRAIAVLAVMLYHANVPGFGGGYVGVDIFFGISGFLITGIIARALAAGQFSFTDFYLRRIRRIVPALAMMCLLCMPAALALMMPEHLENFGQSLFATALSANNVLLYLTSGYFQEATRFRPLFHTWSLGVEEQYYLLCPLLLVLAWRIGKVRGAFVLLAVGTAISMALRERFHAIDGEAAFLLLPTRLWELGLGGIAALAQPRLLAGPLGQPTARRIAAALGLMASVSAVFWLGDPYETGTAAMLVPLLGTCAVLVFGSDEGAGRLLVLPPAVGLGLISYGAYLYHAPLMAFLTLTSLEPPPWQHLTLLIPLAVMLAWLSWRLIERPLRDPRRTTTRFVLCFSAVTLGATASVGLALHLTGGLYALSDLAQRDPQLKRGETARYNEAPRIYENRSFATASREKNVLVIGNSFARDVINMGLESGYLSGYDISYSPIIYCDPWPTELIQRARQANAVIMGASFGQPHIPCMRRAVDRLTALGVEHVAVVGMKSFGFNNNAVMLLPPERRFAYRAKPDDGAVAANRAARAALPAGTFVDPYVVLDDGSGTVPVFTPQRRFISEDSRHLTRAGAHFLGKRVFAQPALAWLVTNRAPTLAQPLTD